MSFKSTGYKSVPPQLPADWTQYSTTTPVLDYGEVAYGWVIEATPEMGLTDIMRTDLAGNQVLNQDVLNPVMEVAVSNLIQFYNKKDTLYNHESALSNAFVKDARVDTRPDTPLLLYVLVDARGFDAIPEAGMYAEQAVAPGSTIHTLADDYRGFFNSNNDRSESGHRARITEILQANGIDIQYATEDSIKEWIATVNSDPDEKIHFKIGAKVNLPVIEIPNPPTPAHIISLEIGKITSVISEANINLEVYKEKIKTFVGTVDNLDLQDQIELLKDFYPAVRTHLGFNDIEVKYVNNEEIEIFLNDEYEVIYFALNKGGEKIPLIKGMIALGGSAPFNNLRTMALLTSIEEIKNLEPSEFPWERFIETYILPPVEIRSLDSDDIYDQLQFETNSVVGQLSERFDKASTKTVAVVQEEDATLANPSIMMAAAFQASEAVTFNGDPVLSNLSRITSRLGAAAGGSGAVNAVYSGVLNKISIEKLIKIALQCLMSTIPISCADIIEGVIGTNILLGYTTFKSKLPLEYQYLADRALQVAQSGDFTLFGGIYSDANKPENKTEGLRFIAVMEIALDTETPGGYEIVLNEVCAALVNAAMNLDVNKIFQIPLMFFPDNLPTVDLEGSIQKILEQAIINLLVGVIVKMVETILNDILAACSDINSTFSDIDYGESDLVGAIADRVGGDNLADVLASLFDDLGDTAPPMVDPLANTVGSCALPNGTVEQLTKSECEARGGTWTHNTDTDANDTSLMDLGSGLDLGDFSLRDDLAQKCSLLKALLNDLSRILTPAEITSLFSGNAAPHVLATLVDVISVRHPQLYEKIFTPQHVADLFIKLEKISDVASILCQVEVISRGLGCTYESKCLRDELKNRNYCGDVPDVKTRVRVTELINCEDGFCPDFTVPDTVCIDGGIVDNGMIPKDNASLLFLLKKVINVMYDGAYMAYDTEVSRIPDACDVIETRPKFVSRTKEVDSVIEVDTFNFYKMEEETFQIPLPSWLPKKTVMNPEFARLLGTGYVPPDGDPNGQFGPYTTEGFKLFDVIPTPFESAPLPGVTHQEKYAIFAGDSKAGMKAIDNVSMGIDKGQSGLNRVFYALVEPTQGSSIKTSTFAMKFSMGASQESNQYKNTFTLQIGDIPVDPSTIAIGNGVTNPWVELPALSFGPFESAIYRTHLAGVMDVPPAARQIIDVIADRSGNELVPVGLVPQLEVFSAFVDIVKNSGQQSAPNSPPSISAPGGGRTESDDLSLVISTENLSEAELRDFVFGKMYGDLLSQVMRGVGQEVLNSPLFKKTSEAGVPYIKIIDWTPVPSEEERACNFDPHILALDTVKKRVQEAYEQYITCSPWEDEISEDGLGRENLSALEAASMTGCVMTTFRTYALEQLLRAMYPISVFAGEEFVSKLMVEYIVNETVVGIKRVSQSYFEAFVEQVEFIFALRMKESNPFGSIPDIMAQSAEIGISWLYADAAIREFNGEFTGEEVDEEVVNAAQTGGTFDCNPPSTSTSDLDPPSIFSMKEQQVRSRIKFLIEEQLYSLMPKLQDLICLEGTLTFDDNFLNRRLPLFDVQAEKGELRFAKLSESVRTMEQEEIGRQYGEYLKSFDKWESERLVNLLKGGLDTMVDLTANVGTSARCLSQALAAPLTGFDSIEAPDLGWEGALPSFEDIEENFNEVTSFASDVIGGVASIPEGIATAFSKLGGCVGDSTKELVEIGKDALTVASDSPPTLEEFTDGLEEGTTDKFGTLADYMRNGMTGEFPLTEQNGGLILEKYIKVTRNGAAAPVPDSAEYVPTSANVADSSLLNTGEIPDNIPEAAMNHALGSSLNTDEPITETQDTSVSDQDAYEGAPPVSGFGNLTADGLSISQVLCPRESLNTSGRRNTPFVNNPVDANPEEEALVGAETQVSLIPDINPNYEQIYSLEEWQDVYEQEMVLDPDRKFEDVYVKWSMGVRLVYVAPLNEFEDVPDDSDVGAAAHTIKVPTDGSSGFAMNPRLLEFDEEKAAASRSYRQFERAEVERKTEQFSYLSAENANNFDLLSDGAITQIEKDARNAALNNIKTGADDSALDALWNLGFEIAGGKIQNEAFPERQTLGNLLDQQGEQTNSRFGVLRGGAFEKGYKERAITLLPMSQVDIPININGELKLSQILPSLNIGTNYVGLTQSFEELWQRRFMSKLMGHMKESPGYKLLFRYSVPSNTLLSFSSIYANLLNEMPETFWDGTKGELKTLFEILLNGGDYTYESNEEKERGGNREQMAFAQANMGTSGGTRKPGLFDLAVQTPKLIFKGLAEFMDPVIAPASIIVKAGAAGKLLPKYMKELDEEGSELENNQLIPITVGPFDLPPPMGRFAIALPEYLQPSNYVAPYEGLSPQGGIPNISFEMAVPEVKDTITGQSLAPFMREKIFTLKDGNESEQEDYYIFSKALATFDVITVFRLVSKYYIMAMNSPIDSCADWMIKVEGNPILPLPTLIYPGQKIDLPISAVAMASLPMDVIPYGPGPPHTPLGWVYHGIVAAESLSFPTVEAKERMRRKAGLENKKKPKEKLCIDIDLLREEEQKSRG